MPRYWCPQAWCSIRSWVDLPSLAETGKIQAEKNALDFTKRRGILTRVIRKSKAWSPPIPERTLEAPSDSNCEPEPISPPPTGVSFAVEEAPGEDLRKLKEGLKEGDEKSAARLARLYDRVQDSESLYELAITSYYQGWLSLFWKITHRLPAPQRSRLESFSFSLWDPDLADALKKLRQHAQNNLL